MKAFLKKPIVFVPILVLIGGCLLCTYGWYSIRNAPSPYLKDVSDGQYLSVNFSPDGTTLMTTQAQTQVWDTKTWKKIATFGGASEWSYDGPSYSPDGSRIVSAGYGAAIVWDSRSYREIMKLHTDAEKVYSALYSPDGKSILTTACDQTVRVWDAQDGTERLQIPVPACGDDDPCHLAAAYNADSTLIATASGDRIVRFWDAKSGELVWQINLAEPYPLWSVSFSPVDNNLVAVGAGDVSVWNIQERKRIWEFEGKSGWVLRTVFAPDGKTIAAMGYYENAWILDAQTGVVLHDFSGAFFTINSIAYSPDGSMLAVASDDGFCVYKVPKD